MTDKTNLIFFSFIATNLPLFTHSNNGASQLMHKNLTLQSFAQVPSGVVVFFICANKLKSSTYLGVFSLAQWVLLEIQNLWVYLQSCLHFVDFLSEQ